MCINCMLCYSACPIYGLDSNFIGPAAIALAQRYNLDSRDDGGHERLTGLSPAQGVLGRTFGGGGGGGGGRDKGGGGGAGGDRVVGGGGGGAINPPSPPRLYKPKVRLLW